MEEGFNLGRGRKCALSPLVLTLVRLQCNFSIIISFQDSTINTLVTTWINFMYVKLGSLSIWPSQETLQRIFPNSMKEKYHDVRCIRCIIDCVEFKTVIVVTSVISNAQNVLFGIQKPYHVKCYCSR